MTTCLLWLRLKSLSMPCRILKEMTWQGYMIRTLLHPLFNFTCLFFYKSFFLLIWEFLCYSFLLGWETEGLQVLWLKSRTSEVWLDRRTNYTRSLAVMSMVGYTKSLLYFPWYFIVFGCCVHEIFFNRLAISLGWEIDIPVILCFIVIGTYYLYIYSLSLFLKLITLFSLSIQWEDLTYWFWRLLWGFNEQRKISRKGMHLFLHFMCHVDFM